MINWYLWNLFNDRAYCWNSSSNHFCNPLIIVSPSKSIEAYGKSFVRWDVFQYRLDTIQNVPKSRPRYPKGLLKSFHTFSPYPAFLISRRHDRCLGSCVSPFLLTEASLEGLNKRSVDVFFSRLSSGPLIVSSTCAFRCYKTYAEWNEKSFRKLQQTCCCPPFCIQPVREETRNIESGRS